MNACLFGYVNYKVACRDFPHSRHLCANFPFSTTSHEKHCNLCHCFVCDSPAPCNYWGNGISFSDHCHATDKDETWRLKRKQFKKTSTATLPSQMLPVLKRPPIRNTRPIITHNLPSSSPIMPNQPSRPPTLRPCSAAITSTAYLPAQRPHQNPTNISHHRQTSLGSSWSAATQRKRVNRSGSALAPISLSPFKRVGASGSMTLPQRPQQPRPIVLSRTQSMPVNSPRSPCTPLTTQRSQNDDSIRQWQDIIAGVAAELGVSECVSQPYTPTSSSQASDMSSQGMGLHTNVDPTTFSSKSSIDFDGGWLDGTSRNLPGQGPAISANDDDLSRDNQLGSLLAPVENTAFVPGKVAGLREEDPASFLYDLDCSWSSIANV
ncbi:uncharacterized protein LOC109836429 isoform X2 [Asparagus officinalis]|uniref:uncharacterized protein LOC109836429 isoform X2 n=1 Tax=Asparagus officinalis TaxID=4686 RepID=UPI00098E1904|nr:uncharacterized protein LOC109836429 isoform X2 [Asparagus officinalis]